MKAKKIDVCSHCKKSNCPGIWAGKKGMYHIESEIYPDKHCIVLITYAVGGLDKNKIK